MSIISTRQAFDYGNLFKATPEQRQQVIDNAKKPGLARTAVAAANSEWVSSWLYRNIGSGLASLDPDPNYDPFEPEEWKQLTAGLDPEYWEGLGVANSQQHAFKIRDNMLSVQGSRDTLMRAGTSGAVAQFGAAFLDPTILVASFGVGSIVAGAGKAASAGRSFLRGGAAGLAVDVPAEAYLASQDPERGLSDVMVTAAATFTLGGLGDLVSGKLASRAAARDTAVVRRAMGAAGSDELRPMTPKELIEANAGPKGPWQMSRDEFVDEFDRLDSATRSAEKTPDRLMTLDEVEMYLSDPVAYSRSRGYTEEEIADFVRYTELATDRFPEEYATTADIHREHVEAAIARGEEVPESVLRDYPDLDPARTETLESLRAHLRNEGFDDEAMAELEDDPGLLDELADIYLNPEPPEPADPKSVLEAWDPFYATDEPAAMSRIRRSFVGFLGDERLPAPLRKVGNMLLTDPLAKKNGSVSTMGADQVATRLNAAARDELYRGYAPAFRKFQKELRKSGNASKASLLNPVHGIDEFDESVIRVIERGEDALGIAPGPMRDAIVEGAESGKKFYRDWLDRAHEGGILDDDLYAHLKENTSYFPRSIEAREINAVEAQFSKNDVGKRIVRETIARGHAAAAGVDIADYELGQRVVNALGNNFRGTLKRMDESERAAWVSGRLFKEGFSAEDAARISAYADDPDSLFDEFVDGYHTSHTFARFYLATARNLGSVSDADKFRLFSGKQLESLRRVLKDEQYVNMEFRDEDIESILKTVSESLNAGERGTPSNLRFRSAIDGYAEFDATEMLAEAGYDVGPNGVTSFSPNSFYSRNFMAVSERYSRSMSGHIALNKVLRAMEADSPGPEGDTLLTRQTILSRYEKTLTENGLSAKNGIGGGAYKRLDAALKEIMSIPQTASIAGEEVNQSLRIWRKFVNSVLNGSFSFAVLPESARIVAYGGVRNMIGSMPILGEQLKLARAGKIRNEDLDFGDFLASLMTSGEYHPLMASIDPDDPRSFAGVTKLDRAERIATGLERVSFASSGFLHLERFGRRLTAATAVNKYVNDFGRGRPWRGKKLAAAGLFPEDAARIEAALRHELAKEGGAVQQVKSRFGHKTTKFRIDQFEDQTAASLLSQSMSKWASRVYQESDLGSKYLIQTDPTLKIMTHFMDFVLQGWEKHTLYGVQNAGDLDVYKAMVLTSLLGSATYIAQTYVMHGQDPDGLEKYGLGDEWDFKNVFMAGIQRSGHFSLIPNMADFVGASTGVGPLFDSRSSGLSFASKVPGLEANPTTATIHTMQRALSGIGKTLFRGDDFSRDDAFAAVKALPFHRNPIIYNLGRSIANRFGEEDPD